MIRIHLALDLSAWLGFTLVERGLISTNFHRSGHAVGVGAGFLLSLFPLGSPVEGILGWGWGQCGSEEGRDSVHLFGML